MAGWWRGLYDVVFPPACAACGAVMELPAPLCGLCTLSLSPLPTPQCTRCAEPGTFVQGLCPRCAANPGHFVEVCAPWVHEGALARAIHRYKYEDHPELAPLLAELVSSPAHELLQRRQSRLVAIPLHQRRFRQRSFDQAQLLARALASLLGMQVLSVGLVRTRETARQVGLSESERDANLQGAFQATGSLAGMRLTLVDDVFTTGATAKAAASALLSAGAAEVSVITLARAYSGT